MELEASFQDSCAGGVTIRRAVDRGAAVTELRRESAGIVHRFVMAW
jgi:hypothetical protein